MQRDSLPPRVLFIGGGYIGMEFGHAAARCGIEVTIVEKLACPLKHFDRDLAEALKGASKAAGIRVPCNSCVSKIEKLGDGSYRTTCDETGEQFEADLVVNATGRVPSLDDLNLQAADIPT